MQDKCLIINAGSSSLKFSLYDIKTKSEIVNGYVEKIGNDDSFYTLKFNNQKITKSKKISNHTEAIQTMMIELIQNNFIQNIEEIKGIGHRVLHGGEIYDKSTLIDDEVLNNIKALTKLGPLHHPGEISGIESMEEVLPGIPQVAVFDTAYHQTIPKENYMYPVPYEWYEEDGVRKYGFHGTSHKYIASQMKEKYRKDNINLIICHIGSGASVTAVKDGISYDTTMGLTPLDGLMMGTRSGSIDASILEYICKERNITIEEATKLLNKKGGLLGITTKSDLRDVLELAKEGNERAILAKKMYENSIYKTIGQYYFELDGNVDAIIFTAGVGENSIDIRESIVERLSHVLPLTLDKERNESIASYLPTKEGIITTTNSFVPVYVMPTNEELMIFEDTMEVVNNLDKDSNKVYKRGTKKVD